MNLENNFFVKILRTVTSVDFHNSFELILDLFTISEILKVQNVIFKLKENNAKGQRRGSLATLPPYTKFIPDMRGPQLHVPKEFLSHFSPFLIE